MVRSKGNFVSRVAGIWGKFHLDAGIGAAWCSLMHDSPRWPIHGHYGCGICGRRYRVPWDDIVVFERPSPDDLIARAVTGAGQ